MDIFENLNENQIKAVKHLENPLLILAGAGSGKTKTIISRLAYLIEHIGIPSHSTLTLTFTNKAAYEMQSRALNLLSPSIPPPLLCTFHKFGLLFLKFHIGYLNRDLDFALIDSEDRKRIMKIIRKSPSKRFNSQISNFEILEFISRMKNAMILPPYDLESMEALGYKIEEDFEILDYEFIEMYRKYEEYLLANNMVDFDDLLLLPYIILSSNSSLAVSISKKYNYIMVDEYQDTNDLQFMLLKLLCTSHSNLCVVGDEDQSIYGFRGANINNILTFSESFLNTSVIKLEKNYRSSDEILTAANKLISNNTQRLGKNLYGVKGPKGDVELIECSDEINEANSIASKIKSLLKKGESPSDIAILFRINSLSRSIEDELRKANIPYKLIGTLRFYDRAEIKDVISYFRVVLNINDSFSLLRIINKPRRGIGKVSQDKLEAISFHTPIYEAFIKNEIPLPPLQLESIKELFNVFLNLRSKLEISLIDFLSHFREEINILDAYELDSIDDRKANIDEFYGYFADYINNNPKSSLASFLEEITINSTNDEYNENNYVSCMSVHSSKGLEFKHVFIMGFENGLFPIDSIDSLQEERRVAYVAYTRAKDSLHISYAASRLYKGKRERLSKSRFLKESGLINLPASLGEIQIHDLIMHNVLGAGRVVGIDKDILEIDFGGNRRHIKSSFVRKI